MIILSISPVVIDSQTPSIPSRFGNISTGSKYQYASTLAYVSAIFTPPSAALQIPCKLFIGRNIVCHLSIVKLLICNHIKIAGSGKSKNDSLFFSGFFTFQRLVNGNTNRMRTLRCRKDSLYSCKLLCSSNTEVCSTLLASISPSS